MDAHAVAFRRGASKKQTELGITDMAAQCIDRAVMDDIQYPKCQLPPAADVPPYEASGQARRPMSETVGHDGTFASSTGRY